LMRGVWAKYKIRTIGVIDGQKYELHDGRIYPVHDTTSGQQ
jgi:hypothetical protein